MTPRHLFIGVIDSPIDPLALAWDEADRLRAVSFGGAETSVGAALARLYPGTAVEPGAVPNALMEGLAAYFDGDRAGLAAIAWSLDGATGDGGFQSRVWRLLADIPAGRTISYAETARRAAGPDSPLGHEAARAAGVALNRNPIALVLPCHRVVGADGAMTGFGGGLKRKTWLLRHEGALLL